MNIYKKNYRRFLMVVLFCTVLAAGILFYFIQLNKLPDVIYINAGEEQEMDFHAPVSGTISKESVEVGNYVFSSDECSNLPVDFSKTIVISGSSEEEYLAKLKLFGFLPYKTVKIESIESKKLIPIGAPIGIYLKMEGVLVLDTGTFQTMSGEELSPAGDFMKEGDYIVKVDDIDVSKKSDLVAYINESAGKTLHFTIKREDSFLEFDMEAVQGMDSQYKIGVWIRDSIQGIGTITFVDEEGHFAALGHGISDMDTNELIDMEYGTIYDTTILAVKKGERGEPGEITGMIQYSKDRILGDIVSNTQEGISGNLNMNQWGDRLGEAYPIGLKKDVKTGHAQILTNVNDVPTFYDVEIQEINYDISNSKRALAIKVTDKELLSITGGIVQGMSGSPIIQDGKIIGAVTHVLVSDPTQGYGIFVENMLSF